MLRELDVWVLEKRFSDGPILFFNPVRNEEIIPWARSALADTNPWCYGENNEIKAVFIAKDMSMSNLSDVSRFHHFDCLVRHRCQKHERAQIKHFLLHVVVSQKSSAIETMLSTQTRPQFWALFPP